jgi:ABC-type dipeptide/oligopeptide/nickel transport system ATPase component
MPRVISDLLEPFIAQKRVISIAGASSSGKTTLALSLVGNFLSKPQYQERHAIWIQASEIFPRNRFETMYALNPEILSSINERLNIIPYFKPCESYEEQNSLITKISKEHIFLPPDLMFLVIDNISHHLRYKISQCSEVRETVMCLNHFFNAYLLPLILFCIHENIWLILIHEATFDVSQKKIRPFFYKTYERIDALHIFLHKNIKNNNMKIKVDNTVFNSRYKLINSGILVQGLTIL